MAVRTAPVTRFQAEFVRPTERPDTAIRAKFMGGKVIAIPFQVAARAQVYAVIVEHPALALWAVFIRTRIPTIPAQVTIRAMPHPPVVQPGDVSATLRTAQSRRVLLAHPIKIRFDLGQFARGAPLTELLPQPHVGHLFALAVVATVYAVAQWQNIRWISARAVFAAQWNPVIMGERVPQPTRTLTYSAFVTPIIQRNLPILLRKMVGQFALTQHIHSLRGLDLGLRVNVMAVTCSTLPKPVRHAGKSVHQDVSR